MKRNGYRKQKACANCKRCFIRSEYDEGDELFCTFGATKRPPCGSVAMGENCFAVAAREAWDKWADKNRVHPHGICDKWTDKEA